MDLAIDLDGPGPRRRRLEHVLREAIRAGQLAPGGRLPATRSLAADLGVSRGVVVDAYAQLVAEGYLIARRGDGTRVAGVGRPRLPSPPMRPQQNPARFDLRPGRPDPRTFPRRAWQRALAVAGRDISDDELGRADSRGLVRLRAALAEHLGRTRGVLAEADQIVICCGSAHGFRLLCEVLARRQATAVAYEEPGWPQHRALIAHAGLTPCPVPVDESGLVVEQLFRHRPNAVVVTPAHQYPTGSVLDPQRRLQLVRWAQAAGVLVIEDDYDAEYRYDRGPVAALQGLAPECVGYLGTTSKTVSPALRLAWMVLPPELVVPVTEANALSGAIPSAFDQLAFAELLMSGELDRHLRRTRRLYRRRRDALEGALAQHLPEASVSGAAGGLHLLVRLPSRLDAPRVVAVAQRSGIALQHASPSTLVLGYALHEERTITAAVRELATICRSSDTHVSRAAAGSQ